MNIKLNYLYRDAGNYKQYGEEVFTNVCDLALSEIEERIKQQLIDGEYIDASKWGLRDMHFEDWDQELDLPFHEFINVESTTEPATQLDIVDFLQKVERSPQLS